MEPVLVFLSGLAVAGQREVPLTEPIVAGLFLDFLPVFAILLQVPALTMRLLAEEKRTGSMEVLLTAPVNEWPVDPEQVPGDVVLLPPVVVARRALPDRSAA